ncbi:MAG: hypothetical protein QXK76_03895 [Candidatus Woesearchaeota archaeon]
MIKNKTSKFGHKIEKAITNKNAIINKKNNSNKYNNKNNKPVCKPYRKVFILLLIVFILGILLTIIVYNKYKLLDYKEIPMTVTVLEGASSFNTSTESLNFAKIYPGGSVIKRINIYVNATTIVSIKSTGNISNFISLSDNNFLMRQGDMTQLEVYLDVPKDAPEGRYDGLLKIYFYRK